MKLGDTSLPSSPLPGQGSYLLGTVSLMPSLGLSRVYKTLEADPATLGFTTLAAGWSCRCVTHHHGGSIGDRLILLPPQCSLPLALSRSYHCGPHYPCQQGAGTTIVGFITLSLCWSSGPAIMGVATYALLLRLWFRHIGVGLIMSSWGSLHTHWAGPSVLWFTKSAAGWYLHRGVPYLIVVLACHVGAGLAWVSGSYFCHWAHLLLMGVPHPPRKSCAAWFLPTPHSQLHSWYCWHVWRCHHRDQSTSLNEGRGRKKAWSDRV